MRATLKKMGRFPVKVLVLLAIALTVANAGCLARCIVQSCQDAPPPCHSHNKGDGGHCPQQNQVKLAATVAVALDGGAGFSLVALFAKVTRPQEFSSSAPNLAVVPLTVSSPLALRI
jgi:hypothetical protein